MDILTCPLNGPRRISEFVCGREVREWPHPLNITCDASPAHRFMEEKVADEVMEWWMHAPSGYWFIACRNTLTDRISDTYSVEEFFGTSDNLGQAAAA